MNPFSMPVLGGAAVVGSPALWGALAGQTQLTVGLSRYLVCVVLCWLALSVLAAVVGPVPAREPADAATDGEVSADAVA